MADPSIVACLADAWTKVATNVTTGQIHVIEQGPEYLQTYRDTGGGVPTAQAEGVPLDGKAWISATAGIDVYVWAIRNAGSVRVDL